MKKKKKLDKKSEALDNNSANETSKKDQASKTLPEKREDLTTFKYLILILSFAAYSSTCYRSFPGGDSTELIGNGSEK